MKKEIVSLEAPVDLGSGILNSIYAATLLKDFVEAIQDDDMTAVE